MIIEYHRPEEMAEALQLLARKQPNTVPLAGGTALNRPGTDPVAVVDLQGLGLDQVQLKGQSMHIGAMVTLQRLLEENTLQPAFHKAIRHEATYNLRQVATLPGTLIAGDGRSPLVCVAMALDIQVRILPANTTLAVGELLPVRKDALSGGMITEIVLPMNVKLAYKYVARTPADLSIVCVAIGQWPSGRTRVVVGGFGALPKLALDGQDADGFEAAVGNVCASASDQWGSAEYRREAGIQLTRRALVDINKN